MNPKHIEEAIAEARANANKLTRSPDGTWAGASVKRFSSEVIASLVKDKVATYTRFREGTKAAVEITLVQTL